MKVCSVEDAWGVVNLIFPTDYEKDEDSTKRAGYPIYRSTAEERYYCYICNLNTRLEINLDNGKTVNVWIATEAENTETKRKELSNAEIAIDFINQLINERIKAIGSKTAGTDERLHSLSMALSEAMVKAALLRYRGA